jgi:hypothetical protein
LSAYSPTPPPGSSPSWNYATAATPASKTASATPKTPGCPNLPYHDLTHNQVWLAITALAADLLAWTQRLALTGAAARYEPKQLRLRILGVAGRLVRTARRTLLKIPDTWPWAHDITTAHARLAALTP